MDDSEKLTALKKAYADIILNTAKEAAARIMASERKAQRYQLELFAAKDESLRMLLRLKQTLDSKASEAEMASLIQQRRIEELEAQLGEAEDIVKDLRGELRELQDELEKVTSSHLRPLDERNSVGENATMVTTMEENGFSEHNSEGENATPVTAMEENRLATSGSGSGSGSIISSLPPLQYSSVTTLETKNSNLNRVYNGNKCYGENDCYKDNCFPCNPDFTSIVMRSKEPELYRNGCTQRIRASERNLLGGNLSPSGQSDGVKNQIFIGEHEEDKDLCKQLIAKVGNLFDVERTEDLVKDVEAANGIRKRRRKRNPSLSVQGVDTKNQIFIKEEDKHICKNSTVKADISSNAKRSPVVIKNDGGIARGIRRKRAARYRRHREYKNFPTFSHQALDDNVQTREDSGTIVNISEEDPEPLVETKSASDTQVIKESGYEEAIIGEADVGRTYSFQNAPNYDKLSINELESTGQDTVSALSSEFPACKTNLEVSNVLLSNSDLKDLGANETAAVQPVGNKFLKYTFQRKRKKEFPSCPDGDSSLENGTLKRKMEEKQSSPMESHKSVITTESSIDNRRLTQVAHELISSSEKKWR